jgi:hypothetical protein
MYQTVTVTNCRLQQNTLITLMVSHEVLRFLNWHSWYKYFSLLLGVGEGPEIFFNSQDICGCNVWVCVCVGFVMCGFCKVWVCVCVGFVKCGCFDNCVFW